MPQGFTSGGFATGGGGGSVATDTIWDAAGDLAVGTGANAAAKLAKGTSLQVLRVNAGESALEWASPAGGGDALVANPLSQFAVTTSLQLKNTISDETGSGALVFADTPTLVTPVLGTPTSGTLSNCTGYTWTNIASKPTTLSGFGISDGQPLDATLTAFAGVTISANSLTIGTGADAFSQTSFAVNTFPARASTGDLVAKAITDFGLSLVDDADNTTARTTLGLGTLATQSGTFSGTSSGTNTGDQTSIVGITGTLAQFNTAVTDADLARTDAANTFTGVQTFSSAPVLSAGISPTELPVGIIAMNTGEQSQAVVSGTAYYITNSAIVLPNPLKSGMVVGTRFIWDVYMTKTAAGTGTFQIRIYRGTNGSTADTADVTQTIGTQTAAVDSMHLRVTLRVASTGGSGSYFWTITPVNKAVTATGFGVATGTNGYFSGTVSGVAMNTAALQFGLGFIATTGTPTIRIVSVEGRAYNIS